MTRIHVLMRSQHRSERRTNNVCEGFHNGLLQNIGIVHPNPFVTIQLLRRVDEEATRRFQNYLAGNVVKHIRRRSLELEEKIRNVIERYNKHRTAVDTKQFLDSISTAYLEFYHNEKLARRDISLNVITMSKQHMDDVTRVLEEQNKYDPLEDSVGEYDYIERDAATEILFDSAVDMSQCGEVMIEFEEETSPVHEQSSTETPSQILISEGGNNQRGSKRANVTKPRRKRSRLMLGLEKARAEARLKHARRPGH